MAHFFNPTPQYNPFNQPDQSAAIENLVAQTKALIQQIQITCAPYAYSNNAFQPPNDIIENPTTFKKRELQPTSMKPVGKIFPKKTLCPRCRRRNHPILKCPDVKHLDEKQIPEALKFTLGLLENIITVEKFGIKERTQPPSSIETPCKKVHPDKSSPPAATKALESYDVPEVDPEVALEDITDSYLEDLDTWLPEPKNDHPPRMNDKEKDNDGKTIFDENNEGVICQIEKFVSDKEILKTEDNKEKEKELIRESETYPLRGNFDEPIVDLDKAPEIEPEDANALANGESKLKNENHGLAYSSKKEGE
ncbi:6314_t:CDS:2, partial [Racocetra fulgida]